SMTKTSDRYNPVVSRRRNAEGSPEPGVVELFIEHRESLSVEWTMGSTRVRYGRRDGAGLRRWDRAGVSSFRAFDDPSPERIEAEVVSFLANEDPLAGRDARGRERRSAPDATRDTPSAHPVGGSSASSGEWVEAQIAPIVAY